MKAVESVSVSLNGEAELSTLKRNRIHDDFTSSRPEYNLVNKGFIAIRIANCNFERSRFCTQVLLLLLTIFHILNVRSFSTWFFGSILRFYLLLLMDDFHLLILEVLLHSGVFHLFLSEFLKLRSRSVFLRVLCFISFFASLPLFFLLFLSFGRTSLLLNCRFYLRIFCFLFSWSSRLNNSGLLRWDPLRLFLSLRLFITLFLIIVLLICLGRQLLNFLCLLLSLLLQLLLRLLIKPIIWELFWLFLWLQLWLLFWFLLGKFLLLRFRLFFLCLWKSLLLSLLKGSLRHRSCLLYLWL